MVGFTVVLAFVQSVFNCAAAAVDLIGLGNDNNNKGIGK